MFFLPGRYCRWEISSGINTNEMLSRFLGEKGWSSVSRHPRAESVSGSGGEALLLFWLRRLICCFAEQCHFNPAFSSGKRGKIQFFFPSLKLKKKKILCTQSCDCGGVKSHFSRRAVCRKTAKMWPAFLKKKNLISRHNFSHHQWRQSIVIHFAIHSYLSFFCLVSFRYCCLKLQSNVFCSKCQLD